MDNAQLFTIFKKLYEEKKVKISWRKNSVGVSIVDFEDIEVEEKELKNFTLKLMKDIRKKVLNNAINTELDEYANELLNIDEDLKSDVLTRCKSNANICNYLSYETLTKRNRDLDIIGFSTLVNLNLEKPNNDKDLCEQVTFELSIKDLKLFHKVMGQAIDEVEKLKDRER